MKKLIALTLALLTVALLVCACGKQKDENTIKVGASSSPHAEILAICKPLLEAKGYTLNISIYDDYVLPNTATESGDLDANFFQHAPYLDKFNSENNTHLVSVCNVHFEPLGIYAGTLSSLEAVKTTTGAKIAVPNDDSNEARALLLLEAQGIIKLKEGVGVNATKYDIVENPYGIELVEMTAGLIPGILSEVALAVINGNYALAAEKAGNAVGTPLIIEDPASAAALTYANILVVKTGNENNAAILALKEALQSQEVKDYINNTYSGAVLPVN